jgi:hypothetical protein
MRQMWRFMAASGCQGNEAGCAHQEKLLGATTSSGARMGRARRLKLERQMTAQSAFRVEVVFLALGTEVLG